MTDMKQLAAEGLPFDATTRGPALEHRGTAFIDQPACGARAAKVGRLFSSDQGGQALVPTQLCVWRVEGATES